MDAPPTTLAFLGAAGTVTGSKFLLTVGERRILVDAGLFQGEKQWRRRNWDDFPVPPDTVTDVVLTHAHLDHCGHLPRLVAQGFRGPVWCTAGTRDLAGIVLRDAASLAEREAEDARVGGWSRHDPPLPLYTVDDVEATLPLLTAVDLDAELDLGDGITVRFTRAGHILGAASVRVTTRTTSVLFSGDLGRRDHPVLRPRETPPGAAYVVVESTYGDRHHPEPANLPHEALADAVRRTVARGGSVLVPAFAVDRTEVVLRALVSMREEGRIPHVPVHVDSPMGARALAVYLSSPDELRPEGAATIRAMQDLHVVTSVEGSKALTRGDHGPRIVITSSGMLSGGRAVHHLAALLPDRRNTVVLTGYQAAGTRGRALLEGASHVKIHGEYVPVRAEVVSEAEFSVHADAGELDDWLRSLDPAPHTVFVVHGEPGSAQALATRVRRRLGLSAVVPSYGEQVLLAAAPGDTGPPDHPVEGARHAPSVDLDTLLEDNVALLRRHDVAGLAARYAPDAEIVHAGGVATGREAIAALYTDQAELGPEVLRAEVVGRGEDSLAYRARMRLGGEDVDVVGSFVLRDGLIWRQTSVVVDRDQRA